MVQGILAATLNMFAHTVARTSLLVLVAMVLASTLLHAADDKTQLESNSAPFVPRMRTRRNIDLGAPLCSPRNSELTCIVGCFKCAQTFGRKMYDTTSCCAECQHTQALLLDDGPEFCSSRFFVGGWPSMENMIEKQQ